MGGETKHGVVLLVFVQQWGFFCLDFTILIQFDFGLDSMK